MKLQLNAEQALAAYHGTGPLRIVALAGSGKSSTLVERVAHLVEHHRVPPSQILMITFSKTARDEVAKRLDNRLPGLGASSCARTFHSIGLEIYRQENMGRRDFTIDTSGRLFSIACREACAARKLPPKRAALMRLSGLIKNNMLGGDPVARRLGRVDPRMIKMADQVAGDMPTARLDGDTLLQLFFDAERIRTDVGVFDQGTQQKFVTFDDMIYEAAIILGRKSAKEAWGKRWRYVLQDEAQDVNAAQTAIANALVSEHRNYTVVGDPGQCVAHSTQIALADGRTVAVSELQAGAQVLSLRNGKNVSQPVRNVWNTGEQPCVEITTSSGQRLTMSEHHRIWATTPVVHRGGEVLLYLMHREGFGFRLGITNRGMAQDNKWGNRMTSEGAGRLWVIECLPDRETALLKETATSLTFAIPTMIFNAKHRGLNQARANALFAEFGQNGLRLLHDRGLHFDYPHWFSSSTSQSVAAQRRVIRLVAHAMKGSVVTLEWSHGPGIDVTGLPVTIEKARTGGVRIRKWFQSLADAEALAEELSRRTGAAIVRSLSPTGGGTGKHKLLLLTASALHVGMRVPVLSAGGFQMEDIVDVQRTRAECYDVTVGDSANFYGNNILSHNCIYGFRGTSPESILDFDKTYAGATTILMHRNYRSGIEICALASRILESMPANSIVVDDFGNHAEMYSERQTHAYVIAHYHPTRTEEAERIADNIIAHRAAQVPWEEQAILVRMNRMTRDIEISLAQRQIPYRLVSGSSFFTMSEALCLLGYLRIIAGRATAASVIDTLRLPSRKLRKVLLDDIAAGHAVDEDWIDTARRVAAEKGKPHEVRAVADWARCIEAEYSSLKRSPGDLCVRLRQVLKLDDYFGGENEDSEDSQSKENITAVVRFAQEFGSCDELIDLLDMVESHRENMGSKRKAVVVSTVHRAKGREWSIVYGPCLAEGEMPASRADLAEERRVFYVLCTRAKDELWLSWSPSYISKEDEPRRSRFLDEVDLPETVDYVVGAKVEATRVGSQLSLL